MTTVGSGWTKVSNDGKTQISIQIDEVLKEMIPQLKNLRFGLVQLVQSERTSEKSPHWKVYAYVPQQMDSKKVEEANKAITESAIPSQEVENFEEEYAYGQTQEL